MKFTGERYVSDLNSAQISYEHWHRYFYATQFVKGKDVLDIACGEGYGTDLIAQTAKTVVGVDISQETIDFAKEHYRRGNLSFLQGSVENIPIQGAKKFDIVISFETIEHVDAGMQESFLKEVKRLLKDGGVFVVSSPNKLFYSDIPKYKNEFHLREFYEKEFVEFLHQYFEQVSLLGQKVFAGSDMWQLGAFKRAGSFVEHQITNDGQRFVVDDQEKEALYLVAVCSDVKVKPVEHSLLLDKSLSLLSEKGNELRRIILERDDRINTLQEEVGKLGAWGQAEEKIIRKRDDRINTLQAEVEKLGAWGQTQSKIILERDGQIVSLNQAVQTLTATVAQRDAAVSERDSQIISLGASVAERDGQIAGLRQVVTERDQAVMSLTGTVAQCDAAVSERDGQIASLNQAVQTLNEQVTERDAAMAERDGQIASLKQAVAERDGQIYNLNQTVVERDGQITILNQAVRELNDETVRRGEWALGLEQQLKDVQAKLAQITSSNSWKITLPLREMRRWVSAPKQQAKRYVRGGLRLAKRSYQSLPLSYQTKAAHRNLIAKLFPKMLLASGSHSATIPVLSLPVINQAVPEQFANPADYAKTIEIPASQNPLVSVVIPIYGKIDYTLRCLASIAENPPKAAFEVIVVDDCSPDNSAEVFASINGIRLIRNKQNQGFLRSCNIGAKAAQGEYLHFLNNDTEVTPGWMDELVRTFHEFPGAGFVGSKLVYPDGSLQEAGGIIWQDGSAWNFGRNQDPSLPVYNYAREVDYCSGASIMVPKKLFEELGGFDEHYLPAYCEDSDLALKIRDKGYRVIYQPMSTIIHYEGVTSGTDTSQGTKAYQIENSKKLFERWKGRLQTHQPAGVNVDNAKDRMANRRVLVLDHCTPTPNQDAGSVTAFNIMLLLREMNFQVTFIPESNFLYMPDYTPALQRVGIEVLYAPYCISINQHLKEAGSRYDLAFLFRPGVMEQHLKAIRSYCPNAKVVFHTVDLHFLRMSREADLLGDAEKQKAADQMKQIELAAICAADAAIVHSTAELEILRPEIPDANLQVFPLILDVRGTDKAFKSRRDVVFVGGYQHTPNIDAVQYFVGEIFPLLRRRLPGVRFYAVGSKPTTELKELISEDIIVTGFVDDLSSLLDRMRISVAPLRYGAGIKGKIGSAMAVGLPTVATPLAAEGMSLTNGENILVADGAAAFADAIVRLYQDEALWNRISHNGLEFAENAWGAEAAWKILDTILSDLGLNSVRYNRLLTLWHAHHQAK